MRITLRGFFFLLSSSVFGVGILASAQQTDKRVGVGIGLVTAESYLNQGWDNKTREEFHYGSQGSELVPYYWFLNLVEPDGMTLLKNDLDKFGVLDDQVTPDPSHLNPDNLPIGFVQQQETQQLGGIMERHWLGLTCAACHTGSIIPKDGSNATKSGLIIIDGAPANVDMGAFLSTLNDSVQATNTNQTWLDTLAQKVLAKHDGSSIADIETRFHAYAKELQAQIPLYVTPTSHDPGRLDCIGAIFNRICVYDVRSNQNPPAPLTAPVNFPFVWYSDRQSQIQWFGGVPNTNWLDRFSRNTGEVTGVFAQTMVTPSPGWSGYPTSANVFGLGDLDWYLVALNSPKWTDVFPAPNPLAVQRGQAIFAQTCQTSGCHASLAPAGQVADVQPTPLKQGPNNPLHLPDLDTDENNTRCVHATPAQTGILEGTPAEVVFGPPLNSPVEADTMLNNMVIGSLLSHKADTLAAYLEFLIREIYSGRHPFTGTINQELKQAKAYIKSLQSGTALTTFTWVQRSGQSLPPFDPFTAGYESRSMNGIWATAPYLHNGSIPNMVELLWPDKRESKFYVGSRVYDPDTMGFVSDGSAGGVVFDTSQPGNSNKGHTYGANLTDDQKWDLIAYLKSL
jgi:hypothetical protein